MLKKLQSIIDKKITGDEAVRILNDASSEYEEITKRSMHLGQLISQAESVLIYKTTDRRRPTFT